MSYVSGFHHITLCAGGAQEDIDFFTRVVGQRMIKQTVLFDGRYAHYHLYYSYANAEPGSVMTTFPYNRVPGRPGSGQVSSSAYTIPKGSVTFWEEHLDRYKVPHGGIQERFGQKYIRFSHPSGLQFDAIEEPADTRVGWVTGEIKSDTAMRGFSGTVLSVREVAETERFFGERLLGQAAALAVTSVPDASAVTKGAVTDPAAAAGRAVAAAAGTAHPPRAASALRSAHQESAIERPGAAP